MAQEMKHHHLCLMALYNREVAHLLATENHTKDQLSPEKEACLLVFSELLSYITETKNSSDGLVVFQLA